MFHIRERVRGAVPGRCYSWKDGSDRRRGRGAGVRGRPATSVTCLQSCPYCMMPLPPIRQWRWGGETVASGSRGARCPPQSSFTVNVSCFPPRLKTTPISACHSCLGVELK